MRQRFFMGTETEAGEINGKDGQIGNEIQDQIVTKDLVQDRTTKDLTHILDCGDQSQEQITENLSLEKSRSRRNRKFESRKSLGLDNFH